MIPLLTGAPIDNLYVQLGLDADPYAKGWRDVQSTTDRELKKVEGSYRDSQGRLRAADGKYLKDSENQWAKGGAKAGKGFSTNLGNGLKKTVPIALKALAGVSALAGGVTLLGTTFGTVKAAASFEYEMSRIKAVSSSTTGQLAPLRKTIIQLGKDTVFSAGQTATAATELIKAGVSVAETQAALPGVLALASAGELDVARAAEIASNAMNVFGIAGKDIMTVADALASAANVSSLEVEDLAGSLQYIGPVASQLHMPIQQVVAALAELGNVGIKGEMAGTGFRGMMSSLMSPSKVASDALDQLGVSLQDAQGAIVPFPNLLDQFKRGLQGMTEGQQMELLGKIFDTQQLGVAMQLIKGGSATLDEWTKKVTVAGEAQRVAAEKMDNLKGSWEQFKGSVETLAIGAGTPTLKGLRGLVDALTDGVNSAITFGEKLGKVEGWKGADLTGKIHIAYDELTADFTKWFEGMDPQDLKVRLVTTLDDMGMGGAKGTTGKGPVVMGVFKAEEVLLGPSGEDKLREWGAQVGLGLQGFLKAAIGAAPGENIWVKAGASIVDGFRDSFAATDWGALFWESLKKDMPKGGFFDPGTDRSGGRTWTMGGIPTPGVGDAVKGIWGDFWEWLQGPESEREARDGGDKLGRDIGESAYDKVVSYLKDALTVQPAYAATAKHTGSVTGSGAGLAFADGWIQAANRTLAAWQPPSLGGIADGWLAKGKAGGSGFGADLLAELQQMVGSAGGGAGLTGHTSALAGMFGGRFGISVGSGFRPGATIRNTGKPSLHSMGRALDFFGSSANLWAAFNYAAANAGLLGLQEILYQGKAWSAGMPFVHKNANPQSVADHMDHLHIGTRYHTGGEVGAVLQVGERVITAEQNSFLTTLADGFVTASTALATAAETLPQAADMMLDAQKSLGTTLSAELGPLVQGIRDAVNKDTPAGERTAARDQRIGELFDSRSGKADSYVAREEARLKAIQALGLGIDSQMKAVESRIGWLDAAVAEKSAQLQAAKDLGMDVTEINRLAGELFDLQATAADARKELQELARTPLEDAAKRWANSLALLDDQLTLLGNHSDASALLKDLLPQQLGLMGGQYQSSLDLMGAPGQTPDQIMALGQQASGQVMGMFNASKSVLDSQLSDTMSSIDKSEQAWLAQWEKNGAALDAQLDKESKSVADHYAKEREQNQKRVDDLRKSQDAALKALRKSYDDRLLAMQDGERAITRAEEQARAQKALGKTEDELRILQGQGFYTEADIARMRELETSAQEQRDAMAQQTDAWAREDARTALERERDAAVERLQLEQENALALLEAQIKAADERLAAQEQAAQERIESQRAAYEEERRLAEEAFQAQRDAAQASYQAELDALVLKYSDMLKTVQDQQTNLLGEAGTYHNAGYVLGQSLAQGVWDSLPLIAAAGMAAADTLARYLELHSPAKDGPLSKLHEWFKPFVPTILKPLDLSQLAQPIMDTFGPVSVRTEQTSTSSHEEHIYLHGDPGTNQETLDKLADKISEKLHSRVRVAGQNYGG